MEINAIKSLRYLTLTDIQTVESFFLGQITIMSSGGFYFKLSHGSMAALYIDTKTGH